MVNIADEAKREDCAAIIKRMPYESGLKANMWGPDIVGFVSYLDVHESGRDGDAPLIAFSARANAITIYLPA